MKLLPGEFLSRSCRPDDVAIANCAYCGDMVSDIPICDFCCTEDGRLDHILKTMPKDWPSRDRWQKEIDKVMAEQAAGLMR